MSSKSGACGFTGVAAAVLARLARSVGSAAFAWLLACSLAAQTYQVLHSFADASPDGSDPHAALIADAWGNLYGTTYGNGNYGDNDYYLGTVFKLDAANGYALTTLHSFSGGPDGARPAAAVIADASGNLYGATSEGGLGYGTVFRLDAANDYALTTLHTFTSSYPGGTSPWAALILDGSGNLYGTTAGGGLHYQGTVFKLDAANGYALTTLHSFGGGPDGGHPYAAVIADPSGNLYGTTNGNADYGDNGIYRGTVFKLDAANGYALTTLHSFGGGPDGAHPYAAVIADASGNLYGTTAGDYDEVSGSSYGTVYKLDAANGYALTTLAFSSTLVSALIADASGNLYGTSFGNVAVFPPWYYGTIFKLTAANNYAMTTLLDFDDTTEGHPLAAVIADAAGNLFGTASDGGSGGGGVVFSLINGVPAPVTGIVPTSGPSEGGTAVTITGTGFSAAVSVRIGGTFASGVTVVSPTEITATTPPLPPGRLIDVAVTNALGGAPGGPSVAGALPLGFFSDFLDVPQADIFHADVETVFRNGITAGCGAGNYCRNNPVTRAQIAVFLLKAEHGSDYAPPACTGMFLDVACTPTPAFAVDWIERLFNEAVTDGCGAGNYCPGNSVTRAQMSVLLLKAEHGSGYTPSACTGLFPDVECAPTPAFAVDWIEQLYNDGITGGCAAGNYCPDNPVTRGQMAAFLVKTFGLQ